jgi:hypothetical protein
MVGGSIEDISCLANLRDRTLRKLIREYVHLYGAVCPQDGTCVYLIRQCAGLATWHVHGRSK